MSSFLLTSEKARGVLKEIIEAFSLPDHVSQLNEAKHNAGNDMILYMQLVFPLAMQIQLDVIKNYGFSPNREGLLQFTQSIKLLRNESLELSHMDDELGHLLLPQFSLPCPLTLDKS